MNEKNFDVYIDLGSSTIRAACFNKHIGTIIFSTEDKCSTYLKLNKLNFVETERTIEKIIFDIEKKTGKYLNNVSLMLDTSDAFSISLSVAKNNESEVITKQDIQYLIQGAKQEILNSNLDKNIIHIIVNNYKVDDKDYDFLPLNSKCKNFSIDIIFICFPKMLIKSIEKLFHKHQILVDQFICSSYAKSYNYKKHFDEYSKIAFLDIGYEKTSIICYEKNRLKSFDVLSIGGHHITKDIANILKLDTDLAEKIKSNLNKNIIFSDIEKNNELFDKDFLAKINKKELSLDLIKKIIFARIDETLTLSFSLIENKKNENDKNQLKIILIGQGAKILNNMHINIAEKKPLAEEIDFFEESIINICQSGLRLTQGINKQEVLFVPKKIEKKGLFERLFYLFK